MRYALPVQYLRRGRGLKIFQIPRRRRPPRFMAIGIAVCLRNMGPSRYLAVAASRLRDLLPGARNEAVAGMTLGSEAYDADISRNFLGYIEGSWMLLLPCPVHVQ